MVQVDIFKVSISDIQTFKSKNLSFGFGEFLLLFISSLLLLFPQE